MSALPPLTIATTSSGHSGSSSAQSSAANTPGSAPFAAPLFGPYQRYYTEITHSPSGKQIPVITRLNELAGRRRGGMDILPVKDVDGRYLAIFKDNQDNSFAKYFTVDNQRHFWIGKVEYKSFEMLLNQFNAQVTKESVFSFEEPAESKAVSTTAADQARDRRWYCPTFHKVDIWKIYDQLAAFPNSFAILPGSYGHPFKLCFAKDEDGTMIVEIPFVHRGQLIYVRGVKMPTTLSDLLKQYNLLIGVNEVRSFA